MEFFSWTFSLNKHNINKEIKHHKSMPQVNTNLAQSRGNPVHFCTQNYQSFARLPKGKNGGETIGKQLKAAKNRGKMPG